MKLYYYDHCPYCVRARMMFGLQNVPVEEIVLLNDDEDTPKRLIGAKQVPILTKKDGTHMGESLDIVRYVDELSAENRLDETVRPEIQAWHDQVNRFSYRLMMPRSIQLGLPEFATQSAIDYFVNKKQESIGNFNEHLAKTDEYLKQIHTDLHNLDRLVAPSDCLNGQQISMEDILIFPILRNLSMVEGLEFPEKTLNYVRNMSQKTGIKLYFDVAV